MDSGPYMTVTEARKSLGISRGKMAALIKEGTLRTEDDPLDKRVKLVLRSDVEDLRKKEAPAAA